MTPSNDFTHNRFPSLGLYLWPRVSGPPLSPSPASRWGCSRPWGEASWVLPLGRCSLSTSKRGFEAIHCIVLTKFSSPGRTRRLRWGMTTTLPHRQRRRKLWDGFTSGRDSRPTVRLSRTWMMNRSSGYQRSTRKFQNSPPQSNRAMGNKRKAELVCLSLSASHFSINTWFCGLCQGSKPAVFGEIKLMTIIICFSLRGMKLIYWQEIKCV